jgi:signal transduction histidine kinase
MSAKPQRAPRLVPDCDQKRSPSSSTVCCVGSGVRRERCRLGSNENESAFAALGKRALMRLMHEQLDELWAARDQMELLLRVNIEISADLDLDATLHRIVTAAMKLAGARYGALGVRAPDGTLLSFVHEGIDSDTVQAIGRLPAGKGVLGVLLATPEVLRVADLTAHPAAVGFPEHHPPMCEFLGVPITIRGINYGSLYLTEPRSAPGFSESDEDAVRALASAAAVAIDNARLFERVERAGRWMEAGRAITTALLSEVDPPLRPLQLIAERASSLIEAEQAIVLIPADADDDLPADEVDTLAVSVAVGLHADEVMGQTVPVAGSTPGEAFRSGTPVITASIRYPIAGFTDVAERPAIVVPLRTQTRVLGVMLVARNQHQPAFDSDCLQLMSDFADHATIALTMAAARNQARELSILADRERIAHDLHDQVIQRLFAAGMDLQGTIARSHSPEVIDRLTRTIDDLQKTIEDIRTTIYGLQPPSVLSGDLRQRIQQAVADLTEDRAIATTLRVFGPMSVIDAALAEHAEAVVTEAISNTVRHSRATALTIEVSVADELVIDIVDNGRGIPADNTRRSGLANMHHRAAQNGGHCHISTPPAGGTYVHWTAPLTAP